MDSFFSGNNVEKILNKYGIKDGITTFEAPFNMFTDVINRMYVAKSSPFWQDICDCLLMELLIHVGAAGKVTEPSGNYQRLIRYMKENCTRNLPIKAYADFIGFSEVYFVRFFKKASKFTPHAYLIKLRLEKACNLLVHTNMPINQIATKVGYKTARYFSKAFFERFGVSPSDYRNKNSKSQ